jgi:zinc D-Ala-D-Ala carboxypeptidase
VQEVMKQTAKKMEVVRQVLGNNPLHINSWYRCLALNKLLGSAITSQHLLGSAVDFIAPSYGDPLTVCNKLIQEVDTVLFDQLILEHTWVHISFAIPGSVPRYQVLSLLETGHYAVGLTNKYGVSYEH